MRQGCRRETKPVAKIRQNGENLRRKKANDFVATLWSKIGKNTDKIAIFRIILFPTSEGVREVSERATE